MAVKDSVIQQKNVRYLQIDISEIVAILSSVVKTTRSTLK